METLILPIHSPHPLLLIFYGFGKLFLIFSTFRELRLKDFCTGDGSSTEKPSLSLSMPDGAGAGVRDGVRGQLRTANGASQLQILGCKIALLGGKGEGSDPGWWINWVRSCSKFMAAGNQMHPPQCSINPKASLFLPEHLSESFALYVTASR